MRKWLLWAVMLWGTPAMAQSNRLNNALQELRQTFETRMKALRVVGGSLCIVREGAAVAQTPRG